MPQSKTPSFIRDPDQAAELAALLLDTADAQEQDWTSNGRGELRTRAEQAQYNQRLARYRRWAAELSPAGTEPEPLQIRPTTWTGTTTEAAG